MKRPWIQALVLLITVAILVAIYAHIDLRALAERLIEVHPGYFALALLLFIPQILVTSARWHIMMRDIRPMTFLESLRMVMAGKALNALVPSKLGEMSKAFFLKQGASVDTGRSVSAVVLEKAFDLGGLCAILLLGALLTPSRTESVWAGALVGAGVLAGLGAVVLLPLGSAAGAMARAGGRMGKLWSLLAGWEAVLEVWKRGRGGRLAGLVFLSLLLWTLHVAQIYLFFPSLRQIVPLVPAMTYIPLAILAGLLPITLAGMGTRDTALIFLFAPHADPAVTAGVGILCTMRYWMDTLLGVPFFHRYTSRLARGRVPEPREVEPQ